MKRWLPQPLMSLALCVTWLLLSNKMGVAHLMIGALLGVTIPHVTQRFWPGVRLRRPFQVARYLAGLLWDVAVANLQVAVLVLGPKRRIKPTFITYPLSITHEFAVIVLAGTISLTPGTVTVDVDLARRCLTIHCLNAPDPPALIRRVHERYERPLKEIFS